MLILINVDIGLNKCKDISLHRIKNKIKGKFFSFLTCAICITWRNKQIEGTERTSNTVSTGNALYIS